MKLSVAAGILSQTLPVVSKTRFSALLNPEDGRKLQRDDIVRRVGVAGTGEGAGGAPKHGRVEDRRSRSKKRIRDESSSRSSGVLTNIPVTPTRAGMDELLVCDPSSTDPDVGVLSCGSGRVCKRSQSSLLGGICATAKASIGRPDSRFQAAQAAKKKKRSTNKPQSMRSARSNYNAASTKACNPLSTDADIGVLSCGNGRYCKPDKNAALGGECADSVRTSGDGGPDNGPPAAFGNGGALKNSLRKKSQPDVVECDPIAADIGILSCSPGGSCVKNQSSKLGGFCVDLDRSARRLIRLTYDVGLCDPESNDYGRYSCDCAAFDNTTKTGSIACNAAEQCWGFTFYGCSDTCGSIVTTYSFEGNSFTSVKFCYDFSTPTAESLCVQYDAAFETCEAEHNGQGCDACQIVDYDSISFDCSNVGGPVSAGGQVLDSAMAIRACYRPVENGEYCSLCEFNSFAPYSSFNTPVFLQGFGNITCYGLIQANNYNQISTEKCAEASTVAASSCCVYGCNICDVGATIPIGNYGNTITVPGFGETTCGELKYAAYQNFTIPVESCPAVRETSADACCETACQLCSTSIVSYERFGIAVYVPGFENITTCGELYSAAHVDSAIPEESCQSFAEIAENSCCTYFCDICGYTGAITSDYYGLSVTVPGLGEVTCLDIGDAAYQNSEFNSDTCPIAAGYAREVCCFEFPDSFCDVCGPYSVVPYENDNVTTSIPGVGDVTCYDILLAAYYDGFALNTTCPMLSEVAQESCCIDFNVSCEVCGTYGFIPYTNDNVPVAVPGIGDITCYDVYFAAYVNGTIDNETCPDFSAVAQESCCYYDSDLYYGPCYICGPGQNISSNGGSVTTPEGEEVTCELIETYALLGYLNQTDCAYISDLSSGACCEAPATEAPPSEPAVSPSPSPEETLFAPTGSGASERTSAKTALPWMAFAACFSWLVK